MRLKDYVDEILIRMNAMNVSNTTNTPHIVMCINRARRMVQNDLMPFLTERCSSVTAIPLSNGGALAPGVSISQANSYGMAYTPIAQTVYKVLLPINIIDIYAVILRINSSNELYNNVIREARRTDKKDMFGLQVHAWNAPNINNPVYAVENVISSMLEAPGYYMYLSGLTISGPAELLTTNNSNVIADIWHTNTVDDLNNFMDIENIFNDYLIEYVILQAMVYILQNINAAQAMEIVSADLERQRQNVVMGYQLLYSDPVYSLASQEESV